MQVNVSPLNIWWLRHLCLKVFSVSEANPSEGPEVCYDFGFYMVTVTGSYQCHDAKLKSA